MLNDNNALHANNGVDLGRVLYERYWRGEQPLVLVAAELGVNAERARRLLQRYLTSLRRNETVDEHGWQSLSYLRRYLRSQLAKRGIPFELTPGQVRDIVRGANGKCHYCSAHVGSGAGVDRKNNERGYVAGNVVPCCAPCNLRKGDRYSYEEFVALKKGAP